MNTIVISYVWRRQVALWGAIDWLWLAHSRSKSQLTDLAYNSLAVEQFIGESKCHQKPRKKTKREKPAKKEASMKQYNALFHAAVNTHMLTEIINS